MSDDTEITVPFVDGSSQPRLQLSLVNGADAVVPQTALRANGVHVSDSAPLPARAPALPGSFSETAEASHVLKTSGGVLSAIQANSTATGWFLLIDATSLPANGTVSPRRAWNYSNASETLDRSFDPPLLMTNGAVLVFSSTGPFELTLGAAVAQFSGEMV